MAKKIKNDTKIYIQPKLVGTGTGQNIKTINGNNILGTGDITISTSSSTRHIVSGTQAPVTQTLNIGTHRVMVFRVWTSQNTLADDPHYFILDLRKMTQSTPVSPFVMSKKPVGGGWELTSSHFYWNAESPLQFFLGSMFEENSRQFKFVLDNTAGTLTWTWDHTDTSGWFEYEFCD